MSLREAWNKLKVQHSTPKMCLSKFCELRPPNIKLFDQLPHQVCLCSYHENVRLLLVGLGEHTFLSTKFLSFVEQVHTFVKRERAATFNSLKSSSDGISIVLQVDFSENAMIVAQKEVQSAHWHHPQATLFTAHAWINNDNNFNMVIISDDLNHTKYCIFVLCSAFFEAFE